VVFSLNFSCIMSIQKVYYITQIFKKTLIQDYDQHVINKVIVVIIQAKG